MNNRKAKIIMILFMLFLILIARFVYMNIKYPSPQTKTFSKDEVVTIGNYEISLINWQWSDGEIIHQVYPGYKLIEMDGEEYPVKQERVGLAEITIKKTDSDDTHLDLTEITFESGAWGNQFDMELIMALNPDLDSLTLSLNKGEVKKIVFPITMLDIQFPNKRWKNIDERNFYIVFQYYPVKYQFICK